MVAQMKRALVKLGDSSQSRIEQGLALDTSDLDSGKAPPEQDNGLILLTSTGARIVVGYLGHGTCPGIIPSPRSEHSNIQGYDRKRTPSKLNSSFAEHTYLRVGEHKFSQYQVELLYLLADNSCDWSSIIAASCCPNHAKSQLLFKMSHWRQYPCQLCRKLSHGLA